MLVVGACGMSALTQAARSSFSRALTWIWFYLQQTLFQRPPPSKFVYHSEYFDSTLALICLQVWNVL